jgi:Lon protease-like protein
MASAEIVPVNYDRIPVFPLPETVMFPQLHVPLHVFEPRYRQLIKDVIAGDGIMALALLAPGWEEEYFGAPPLYKVAGVGVLERHERLPDGRFNILLRGVGRIEILDEHPVEEYRTIRARPLEDQFPSGGVAALGKQVETLRECCLKILSQIPDERVGPLIRQMGSIVDPVLLADMAAAHFIESCEERQALLETLPVSDRLDRVTESLACFLLQTNCGEDGAN